MSLSSSSLSRKGVSRMVLGRSIPTRRFLRRTHAVATIAVPAFHEHHQLQHHGGERRGGYYHRLAEDPRLALGGLAILTTAVCATPLLRMLDWDHPKKSSTNDSDGAFAAARLRRQPCQIETNSNGTRQHQQQQPSLFAAWIEQIIDKTAQHFTTTANSSCKNHQSDALPPRAVMDGSLGHPLSSSSLYDSYQVDWKAPILGTGAFGSVHLAFDIRQGKQQPQQAVAIKVMDKRYTDPAAFHREVRALQRIRQQQDQTGHKHHIASLQDLYEDDDSYYMVMDLVEGGDVFDDLVVNGPYSEPEAARVIYQLAHALHFLHTQVGYVHADLKPENLLLAADDSTLSLIDFGCAAPIRSQVVANTAQSQNAESSTTTEEKNNSNNSLSIRSSGTVAYWSPERFNDESNSDNNADNNKAAVLTPEMDMWTVGVILYMLLTQSHPFDDNGLATQSQLCDNICAANPKPLLHHQQGETIPLAQDLLDRLLTVDPQQRLTAAQVIQHAWIQKHL